MNAEASPGEQKTARERRHDEAALLLGSPVKPVAWGWQMIHIYVTIHTGIHQSITTALPQRGGAKDDVESER